MVMRIGALYVIAIGLVSIYGTEVCPFVDGMSGLALGALAGIGLSSVLAVRLMLVRRLPHAPVFERARLRFWTELSAMIGGGLVSGAVTVLGWGFPVASAGKMLLGYVTLGVFTALALALDEEHRLLANAGPTPALPLDRLTSISRRFLHIASALAAMITTILVLIILRDMAWLAGLDGAEWDRARTLIALELIFVTATVLGYVVLLTTLFARNLRLFLDLELATMQAVARGRYDQRMPVGSLTEFGHIAFYTNRMIEGLRERDHIRRVFGKMVSPTVSARLLDESAGLLDRDGRRQEAVILFSDLRQFTLRTEQADPATLVRDLNLYFERMVDVIHREDGVVDKFIGDGIMAVFGLVDPETAPERAVRAALGMQAALDAMQDELSAPLAMGIGVHGGEVIAGAFGAPERLEFTVVGDPVNTAARLEATTKDLGVSLLISGTIHRRLSEALGRRPWRHLGQQQLKGRQATVDVYGL